MTSCKICQAQDRIIYNRLVEEMVCETCHWAIQSVDHQLRNFVRSCLEDREIGLEDFCPVNDDRQLIIPLTEISNLKANQTSPSWRTNKN